MGSKVRIFLGLFLAMVILNSSKVAAARDLAHSFDTVDASSKESRRTQATVIGYDPDCPYGCCGPVGYTGGCPCCTYAGQKLADEPRAKPQN